jgi:hypothetical protein
MFEEVLNVLRVRCGFPFMEFRVEEGSRFKQEFYVLGERNPVVSR